MNRVFKFKHYPSDFYVFKDGWVFSYFKVGNHLIKNRSLLSQNEILRHVGDHETQALTEATEEDLLKAIITNGIIEREYE